MALPVRVRTAFRVGHALAAHVSGACSAGPAWVWVAPIMRSGKSYQTVRDEWTRKREASETYDEAILKYKVRYLELSHWNPEEDITYDLDYVERDRAIRDERAEVEGETALERWLEQYLTDLTLLKMPSSVDYYFDGF